MNKIISPTIVTLSLFLSLLACSSPQKTNKQSEGLAPKSQLKEVRPYADRSSGVVQLTGKDIVKGQIKFPQRTPADAVPYVDKITGEVLLYGTQVDGTGFSYLKYKNKNDLLRGASPELLSREVYLPNGKKMVGKEAIWDTYRLSYDVLKDIFGIKVVESFYKKHGIQKGSDLYFGGIALQENGDLGRWTQDNWRRRVHPIADINGKFQILSTPVFNPIKKGASEKDYAGFGHLPFLPGDYIGHAYGPNFKIVKDKSGKAALWIISEEVTRRVKTGKVPAEVTEILARPMQNPLRAEEKPVELVSLNDESGKPHPDSDRGKEMANTYLIEGFRPTSVTPEGIRITKKAVKKNGAMTYENDESLKAKEYFFMTGSPGNFAGDDYDVILAAREGNPIGPYSIVQKSGSNKWKRYLKEIKKHYQLSWAGRGSFLQDEGGEWWLIFHAVDKGLKPEGSYGGVIPPNTEEYHRNLYAVPIEFVLNEEGKPDMRLLI